MMNRSLVWGALFASVMASACSTKRVNVCNSNTDCKDPAYPFCDVNGEYPASGGDKNVCTVNPDNCPNGVCGCTAGAVVSCTGDQLVTCSSDGMTMTTTTCALGCFSDGTRCATFTPSNGLGGALAMAASEKDVTLPGGAKVDTDLGTITTADGVPIPVKAINVPQSSGPAIVAFVAKSFTMDDTHVVGSNAVAFVAEGSISITGILDVAAHGQAAGPGASNGSSSCAGASVTQSTCMVSTLTVTRQPGASGAGGGTAGGAGAYAMSPIAGGMLRSGYVPLVGGCPGGDVSDAQGSLIGHGGGGGGALQLVSLSDISLSTRGFINAAGGGGAAQCGGGSGGTVILEAPRVSLSGDQTGITANGGAGGECTQGSPDGTTSTMPAMGSAGSCTRVAGAGGTESTPPTDAARCTTQTCVACDGTPFGGGGGAVGLARVASRDGTMATAGSPTISVQLAAGALVTE